MAGQFLEYIEAPKMVVWIITILKVFRIYSIFLFFLKLYWFPIFILVPFIELYLI